MDMTLPAAFLSLPVWRNDGKGIRRGGTAMSRLTRTSPIPAFDEAAAEVSRRRWAEIAKPLGSLGQLEDIVVQIAGLTGEVNYRLDRRAILVLCADNGIVARGVTQSGSEVTAIVARGIARGRLTINHMAEVAHADVVAVDMGMNSSLSVPGLLDRRIAPGTCDMTEGPAMTRAQAETAIQTGIDLVAEKKQEGYHILCTGEVGIGNTTTSSALAAVLLGREVEEVTGRGAGLSSEGLGRKITSIIRAIAVNKPDRDDALDVLAKLGGFDIAAMCGVFLGGALYRIPVLVDGFISSVAALCALRLRPEAKQAILASHISAEPAGIMLLEALGLSPLVRAGLRVGEGTGAAAALPLLDMAYGVYRKMPTFAELNIDAYQPLT
jgi:nicotinate-nucleotide--dimethylbenzimidazole phosphoribosyltransferase